MAKDLDYDYLFKFVLIGDSNVGKTCLLTRFSDDKFEDSFIATIGVDFRVRTLEVDGKYVKLQIWDTAGQERFRSITSAYYKGADGIIIVYDITNEQSFDHVENWVAEIQRYTVPGESYTMFVIGNKADCDHKRQVHAPTAQAFAAELKVGWIEASAKTGQNVDTAFTKIVAEVLDKREREAKEAPAEASTPRTDAADSSGGLVAQLMSLLGKWCPCVPLPGVAKDKELMTFQSLENH